MTVLGSLDELKIGTWSFSATRSSAPSTGDPVQVGVGLSSSSPGSQPGHSNEPAQPSRRSRSSRSEEYPGVSPGWSRDGCPSWAAQPFRDRPELTPEFAACGDGGDGWDG